MNIIRMQSNDVTCLYSDILTISLSSEVHVEWSLYKRHRNSEQYRHDDCAKGGQYCHFYTNRILQLYQYTELAYQERAPTAPQLKVEVSALPARHTPTARPWAPRLDICDTHSVTHTQNIEDILKNGTLLSVCRNIEVILLTNFLSLTANWVRHRKERDQNPPDPGPLPGADSD